MSRRNNLLYFRDLKVGTLDITAAPAEAMRALLQSVRNGSEGVPLADLVPSVPSVSAVRSVLAVPSDPSVPSVPPVPTDPNLKTRAATALTQIEARARSNFEERGLDTLFLALGLASWTADDGGRDSAAPVLLVPLKATQQAGRGGTASWTIRRVGDVKVNEVLVHALREEHGVVLDPESLLPEVQGDDQGESFDLDPVFAAVARAAERVAGFTIQRRWIIGNFAFQKMAIVKDLQQLGDALAQHAIISGIAGDSGAAEEARGIRASVDAAAFDRQSPDQEFLIRDADSSQQRAIAAALQGQNGVISGPPGTGKSQTIANLIAEMVARGKTVLFVAEKRAALEVVLNRLKKAQLDHLCLDCHGAELTRRHVAEQLHASITRSREAPIADTATLHATFVQRRDRLNAHVRSLHQPRQPGGLSLYELYGRILKLPATDAIAAAAPAGTAAGAAAGNVAGAATGAAAGASTAATPATAATAATAISTTRLSRKQLEALDARAIEQCVERVREAASLAALVTGESSSPWVGAVFANVDAVRGALESARTLARELWPRFEAMLTPLVDESRVRPPATVAEIRVCIDTLTDLDRTLAENDEALLRADLDELRRALAPVESMFGSLFAPLVNRDCRRALAETRSFHRGGKLSAKAALTLVDRAREQLTRWRAIALDAHANANANANAEAASTPKRLSTLAAASTAWTVVREELERLQAVFPSRPLDRVSRAAMGSLLDQLAVDTVTPAELLKLREIETELRSKGVGAVLDEIRSRKPAPAPQLWPDVLRDAWLRSCVEEIQLQDPAVPAFRGRLHDEIAEEFRRLDQDRLAAAVLRVQRAHAEAALHARNQYPDESKLVAREAEKRTRHLPLRRLFADAPHVLLALRPCWMASPLSVSQLMPGERPLFDLVIFDEASQVLPEDAVTSLLRGRQAVIAGDQRQLPPTTFFAAGPPSPSDGGTSGDGGDEGTEGFQSILDVMSAFLDPPWSLDWHYRSRDERLIAFSNHRIYGGRLVTFPGPGLATAISHVLVPHVPGDAPGNASGDAPGAQENSAAREVRRVVDLVLEHARTRPHESLGVITMGIEHANRIEMELSRARQSSPSLDQFFAQDTLERFFVKNLERVQGDERDAIILSIGYGKNEAGQLLYRFGPLLQDGGERRLNVAITRARVRMTVVSSFSHADLAPEHPKHGVRLLRGFLEYAASEGACLDAGTVTEVPLNDFEQSVCDELTRHGLKIVRQVGTSRYRIDLAAMHPSRPGRYVMAIECDGASYHAAPTARDRDRLRQQQLEELGWRFHRIWSIDWFLRRDDEVRRTLAAFERAVSECDDRDTQTEHVHTRESDDAGLRSGSGPGQGHGHGHEREEARDEAIAPPRSIEPRQRTTKPSVPPGRSIDDYAAEDLRKLVEWVLSDGQLLTDDEIITELTRELGFHRRGSRITARLTEAIHRVRPSL